MKYINGDTVQVVKKVEYINGEEVVELMPHDATLYSMDSKSQRDDMKKWDGNELVLGDNEKHFIQWRSDKSGEKSQ